MKLEYLRKSAMLVRSDSPIMLAAAVFDRLVVDGVRKASCQQFAIQFITWNRL